MENMIRGTIKELSEVLRVNGAKLDYLTLRGVLMALSETGDASIVGKGKTVSGKGRQSSIWEIKANITLNFAVPPDFTPAPQVVAEAVEAEQKSAYA